MPAPAHLQNAAKSSPEQQMTLVQLQAHLNQRALLLAQSPHAEAALQRRMARRRDGALGLEAARAWRRSIDDANLNGNLAELF